MLPQFQLDKRAIRRLGGHARLGFSSGVHGLEVEHLYERTDDQGGFQLAEVLAGADPRTVAKSEVERFLLPAPLLGQLLPALRYEFMAG